MLFLSFKKAIKGLKDRVGEESLSLGLTSEQIKALAPKVKKCEQVLKMGTNQVEIAEQLDHDIVKEHVHRLRDQLFHLDRLHSSARFCEWSATEVVFLIFGGSPNKIRHSPKSPEIRHTKKPNTLEVTTMQTYMFTPQVVIIPYEASKHIEGDGVWLVLRCLWGKVCSAYGPYEQSWHLHQDGEELGEHSETSCAWMLDAYCLAYAVAS